MSRESRVEPARPSPPPRRRRWPWLLFLLLLLLALWLLWQKGLLGSGSGSSAPASGQVSATATATGSPSGAGAGSTVEASSTEVSTPRELDYPETASWPVATDTASGLRYALPSTVSGSAAVSSFGVDEDIPVVGPGAVTVRWLSSPGQWQSYEQTSVGRTPRAQNIVTSANLGADYADAGWYVDGEAANPTYHVLFHRGDRVARLTLPAGVVPTGASAADVRAAMLRVISTTLLP